MNSTIKHISEAVEVADIEDAAVSALISLLESYQRGHCMDRRIILKLHAALEETRQWKRTPTDYQDLLDLVAFDEANNLPVSY